MLRDWVVQPDTGEPAEDAVAAMDDSVVFGGRRGDVGIGYRVGCVGRGL